jgi:hypothetical protein
VLTHLQYSPVCCTLLEIAILLCNTRACRTNAASHTLHALNLLGALLHLCSPAIPAPVAVKMLIRNADRNAEFESELQTLGALQGKSLYLVKCVGFFESIDSFCIVMQVSN